MLKIESNLKISGQHWGLAFVDGVAYTANVALAAKLLLKGYVVTDQQPDQPEAGPLVTAQELSTAPSYPTHAETVQPVSQSEHPAPSPAEPPAPKPTMPWKRAVTANAADESGV